MFMDHISVCLNNWGLFKKITILNLSAIYLGTQLMKSILIYQN
jgi:hypothetical protein